MMSRSKKIFITLAIAFFILLMYISYDISTRTTFPGAKPPPEEHLRNQTPQPDSLDSVRKPENDRVNQ